MITQEHLVLKDNCINIINLVTEGLNLDLKNLNLDPNIILDNSLLDFQILSQRMILLNKMSQYISLGQGNALMLQKTYKTPELYGLFETFTELNRSVRYELDSLRSLISTAKEQIKIK